MKKVLFATTALVASAGIASAEVKLTGYAEIGVVGGSGMETQFHSDMDVSFHLSGETDGGLTFGAKIDLDEVSGGIPTGANNTFTNATVWVKGAFGSITLGDTDSALDWALQDIGMGTSLTDDHTTHAGYSGNNEMDGIYGGQVLRYDNTFGDFGVALSAQINDCPAVTAVCPAAVVVPGGDTVWALGLKYNTALGGVNLGLGLGYQDTGVNTQIGVSVDAKLDSGFRAILNYKDLDGFTTKGSTMDNYYGIGLGYTSGPLLVTANYGVFSSSVANADASGYGLAVNYDLGGGAVVMAGYGKSNYDPANANVASDGNDTWSLGLGLSF